MRGYKIMSAFVFVAFFTLPFYVAAKMFTGRVIWVADGDVINMLDNWKCQYKLRLQGIDVPERGQLYGKLTKIHSSRLVAVKFVIVEYKKLGRYGRFVAKVLLPIKDMNLKQIEAGLVWHYGFRES